jgi:acetolactate synthase-1/2/3 large subunit
MENNMQDKEPARRGFLKGALVAGAGAASATAALVNPSPAAAQGGPKPGSAPLPSPAMVAAETMGSGGQAHAESNGHVANPGSDFIVDVLRAADIEYVTIMTSSALRGLQESIVNYGGNKAPELIICCHEEAAAGIAHGYAKMAGKPMAAMVHAVVGLQHASMAIYNAWCDRVPMMVLAGNTADASKRRPGVEWTHTSLDMGSIVRDMVKWDDQPGSLQSYAESFMRARQLATTPPMEPVLLVTDTELQENPMENRKSLRIPKRVETAPPQGDPAAIARIANALVGAKHPLIVVDRAVRNQDGVNLLVQLAESLNAPVIDMYGRMNFPTNHYLHQTGRRPALLRDADVILGIEVADLYGIVNRVSDTPGRPGSRVARSDAQIFAISSGYSYQKAVFGDAQRYQEADVMVAADGQTSLPALIEAVRRAIGSDTSAVQARKKPMIDAYVAVRDEARKRAMAGWDASPISTARLCSEIWAKIRSEPKWALVSECQFERWWPQQLWDFTEYKQFMGGSGGYGVGYGLPAAAGAALACKGEGRLPINIQPDGDLLMVPSVLWTLAHHKIPLLSIMHNNRSWQQEAMHLQNIGARRDRNPETWRVGTRIDDPLIDYATVARGMGMWAEGPISDPEKLGPAIARALAVVKSGLPALLDVVTQPR